MYAMANFNKERWGMVAGGNRLSRLMIEECFKWAATRKVFGKRLIDQPVIRAKLALMVAEVETVHSMLEDVTFQMTKMTEHEINKVLAGPIALLKYKQTRVATIIADNACQIFGGRALTQSGMGTVPPLCTHAHKHTRARARAHTHCLGLLACRCLSRRLSRCLSVRLSRCLDVSLSLPLPLPTPSSFMQRRAATVTATVLAVARRRAGRKV